MTNTNEIIKGTGVPKLILGQSLYIPCWLAENQRLNNVDDLRAWATAFTKLADTLDTLKLEVLPPPAPATTPNK